MEPAILAGCCLASPATPRPATPHARAEVAIARALAPFDDDASQPEQPGAPGGWWILIEPELHLGDDVLVPDLAGWRRARMPAIPSVPAITLAPDWVCEVTSPTTGALDRSRKMPVYARENVEHLWLVDPLAHTLEVYRLDAGRWFVVDVHADAARVRATPFEACELEIVRWWLEPPRAAVA